MESSIKYILFDIGGVLVSGTLSSFFKKIKSQYELEPYRNDGGPVSIDPRMHTGKLTTREVLADLFTLDLEDKRLDAILQEFAHTWTVRIELFKLLAVLQKKCTLCILSNSNDANQQYLQESGLYDFFQHTFLSHELGMMKPETDIYVYVEENLGARANELLFIDDQSRCLDPAKKRGWHVIEYKDPAQLLGALKHQDLV